MQAVARDPVSRARTMFDIINEPDVVEMRWEPYVNSSGYEMAGASDIYHQMLDIGYNTNPGALQFGMNISAISRAFSNGDSCVILSVLGFYSLKP